MFSFHAFKKAFEDILHLDEKMMEDGRLRCLGGAEGVGLDLVRATHNADRLTSAALQFAHIDGDTDFDQFSRKCIRVFLKVVLGSDAAAEEWMTLALRQVSSDQVSSCTTTHPGFSLRLLQLKPYPMFLLTANDDFAEDGGGNSQTAAD